MNLHWIDWGIFAVFILGLFGLSVFTKRYTRSVADFMVANRCAGRYLLSISGDMSGIGAISFVALFEMYYKSGLCAAWWEMLVMPIFLLISLSGYVVYRYRETRAMTLAQFFEIRYSKKFRVFTGMLGWLAGIINMGIFPAVTARIFIYLCGLPLHFEFLGFTYSTFVVIMLAELFIALLITLTGGLIVVVVTDFIQGLFCNVAFLAILVFLLVKFDVGSIIATLTECSVPGASLVDPFDTTKAEGFNLWFYLMNAFIMVYSYKAWQGDQGYKAAAINAHENRMAGILSRWRMLAQGLLIMMLPVCVIVLMNSPAYSAIAGEVNQIVSGIENPQIQTQMLVPIALTRILPVGLLGIFVSVIFAAAVSTDDTYLHSWGTMFIQDVVLPFRKKPLSPEQHIRLLRFSIVFVALFIFTFSLIYRQADYVRMFLTVTGAIYVSGVGCALVGGLYWKHASVVAAWAATIIGGLLAVSGIVLQQVWPAIAPVLADAFPSAALFADNLEKFPFNGIQITFVSIMCAIAAFVSISLFSKHVLKRPPCNMQKLLHRGEYAIRGEHEGEVVLPPTGFKAFLPSKEFTGWDRVLYHATTLQTVLWCLFFLVVVFWRTIAGLSPEFWTGFWKFKIWYAAILGSIVTVWFVIGGLRDFRELFRRLKAETVDEDDDGHVQ